MTHNPTFETINAVIRSRRSVKPADMDLERGIAKSLLMELFENANHAPTHGLTEPWRFVVFQAEAKRDLSEVMQRIYRETTPSEEFRPEKMSKMSANPLQAAAVIAIVMARRGGVKIPALEEIEATACAVQNLALSASAAGLAGYWSTPPLVYSPEFSAWLGLQGEDRCLGLFYLGWPKAGLQMQAAFRHAVDEKITWLGDGE